MYKRVSKTIITALVMSVSGITAVQAADEVEVLHWWTSGGEAAALDVLKSNLADQGVGWTDMPVAGGGGTEAMTVLRARVTSGNAPTAVQMLGYDILDWAKEGVLANLNEVAVSEGWDETIPTALQKFSKYEGDWIAAPVNVHSTNWMWINKAALDKAGGTVPESWDDLVALLDNFKEQGIVPIAHGGQPWQDATVFDGVALSMGGDFYKKAFIDLDLVTLGGPEMLEVFERMQTLRSYVDDNFSGRDWNLASAMVIEGKAGVQFMGDWAKGEFIKAGQVPDSDFVCARYPGTQGSVTFNSDQFVMFKVDEDNTASQLAMAKAIESADFQSAFNVVKGSAPARIDVSDADFDACGKKAISDLALANKNGTLFGSNAHGHANPASVKNAIYDVITRQFNGDLSPEDAVKELVTAVTIAQ